MATNFFKAKKGINFDATTVASTASAEGDVNWDVTNHKLEFHDGTAVRKTVSENATQTLTNKTLSGNTATNLISGSGTLTLNTTGTATVPNATDTLVGKATTDVLTNKTLSGNTATNLISGSGTLTLNTTGTMTLPNATDTVVGKATTDTLTNKTLTTPVIASITSGSGTFTHNTTGTITVPNATDTLVGKATTDTLTNKTLSTASVSGITFTDSPILTQIATPSTPSAGFNKIYPKSDGYFYSLDPSGSERKIGSGAGAINYILNPDAEGSTTGWITYADAAGTSPVDGTGGSPTTTWTRSTSSPLRGTGSFLLTKDAANRQGEGASYAFTIDSADQAKPIAITFDYTVGSGTYADGDLTVWLYDVTNSTVIQPAPSSVLSVTAGLSAKWSGYFQTAAASTSYRLIVHVTTTSASAYTVKFDNFGVGSTFQSYGVVADDLSNTRTFTAVNFGTVTSQDIRSQRVGDRLRVSGKFIAATVVAATASITLPVSIDSNKLASGAAVLLGRAYRATASTAFAGSGSGPYPVFYDGSTTGSVFFSNAASSSLLSKATGSGLMSSGEALYFEFDIPVSGWSSNVQVSSDTDTRVVALAVTGNAASATSGNPIILPTTTYDTHGGYNATTGRYTVPVPGYYRVHGFLSAGTAGVVVSAYKNAVSQASVGVTCPTTATSAFSGTFSCIAGDILDIRPGATLDCDASTTMFIERLSGPSQIAASESVNCKYTNTAGTSITSSEATVPYATKVYDTHLAFNGATGVFTAPMAGKYRLTVRGRLQAVNNSTSQAFEILALVTSTPESLSGASQQLGFYWGNGVSHVQPGQGSGTWNLNQGDTLAVRMINANTIGLDTGAGLNVVQIERIGN